jgi:LysR family hydrogen peroxide-inducible transcriptional activator
MTLTELKYIVAVARERHFGKAAEACYVSQPTLSVAIKKLEDELEVKLFERSAGEVTVTPLGEQIVQQAQSVLDQAASIKEIAKRGKDPLAGPLNLGVIYTIGPYLLPDLVRQVIARTPQMPLVLQENFTAKLLEMLRAGEIDCAVMAEPFPDTGLAMAPLYDEPFMAALPAKHKFAEPRIDHFRRTAERNHAAARHGPLLSRPCARGVPRVRALLEQCRRHPQELRRVVARDHQAHGGFGHGRDAGAAPVGAQAEALKPKVKGRKEPEQMVRYLPVRDPARPRPAHAARGAGLAPHLHALRGDRRLAQRDLCVRAAGRQAAVIEKFANSAYVAAIRIRSSLR